MKLLKEINNLTGKLSAINRYSQTRLINPESVLEHTGWVVMCSLIITQNLLEHNEKLNMELVLKKAVLHDVEEALTGDIASPTKYHNAAIRNEIKKVEVSAARIVLYSFSEEENLFGMWQGAKVGKEGFIVELADKLAVVYKVEQEVCQFGNKTIIGHTDGLIPALLDLRTKSKEHGFRNIDIINQIINEAMTFCQHIRSEKLI